MIINIRVVCTGCSAVMAIDHIDLVGFGRDSAEINKTVETAPCSGCVRGAVHRLTGYRTKKDHNAKTKTKT